jgi:thiol-disulfide isomerase/thioredoxin
MKTRYSLPGSILLSAVVITACGGTPPVESMMDKGTPTPDAMMAHQTPTPDAMRLHERPTVQAMLGKETPTSEAIMENPGWYSASFTDVQTGQTFAIDDFKDRVVLVETMAVWCPTCRKQQSEIKALQDTLGGNADLVTISLDIDPNEQASLLGNYLSQTGYDWYYAVAPADISREIASLYGDQFLNPPSTPILVIDRHGKAHPLPFGIKGSEDLLKAIQPYLDGNM